MVKVREFIRYFFLLTRHFLCVRVYGMDIHPEARISWGAVLDRTHPRGIHVGRQSYIASGSVILAHDFCRGLRLDTRIGERCFLGVNCVVLPGVSLGDEVIVGAGSVVTKDVPSGTVVAGNPARIITQGVSTGRFGVVLSR